MNNVNSKWPSVLIAMPAFGGIINEKTTVGLFNTAREFTKLGVKHSLVTLANESLISRGRSRLFSFFANETDFDYMLFIDSDMGFCPDDILKLLELNVDFASAGAPLKSLDVKYNFGVVKENNQLIWNDKNNKLAFSVSYVGTAFMLLSRNVYTKMAAAYPELRYRPSLTHTNRPASEQEYNNSYYFFQPSIDEHGDLKSEDYNFCHRWKKIGGEIWLRPDIQLTHAGSHIFTGVNLQDLFKDQ